MSKMNKKEFFNMLKNGNVIGIEKEVAGKVEEYLDSKLNESFNFDEHNYRIGSDFSKDNLVFFLKFKDILVTTELKDINNSEGKREASKYHEYKVLEENGNISIVSSVVIVVNTPDVEPFYEVEAKLYVFIND